MLVVDEAHHARGHQQRNGEMKPTQFRYMIQNISESYSSYTICFSDTYEKKLYGILLSFTTTRN